MLFTDIHEKQTDRIYPDGYAHDASLDGLRARLPAASVYVLDPQACAMAVNVSYSKPSSTLTALPFARLPAPSIWIEYSNKDVRSAAAAIGSENKWKEGSVEIERTGVLLTETEGGISIEMVTRIEIPAMGKVIDLGSAEAWFDTTSGLVAEADVVGADIPHSSTGRVKKHLELIASDPREAAAMRSLRDRLVPTRHRDLRRLFRSLATFMPQDRIQATLDGNAEDLARAFFVVVLPTLILLNCRNAVETERVEAPAKLNKKRIAKGKPPIGEYKFVKMHLSPVRRHRYEAAGIRTSIAQGALVSGHFKVRKTGVFWWGHHMRGGGPSDDGTRTVKILTP